MGILNGISSVFCSLKPETEVKAKEQKKEIENDDKPEAEVCSKETAEAARALTEASIKIPITGQKLKNINTSASIGNFFPDIDDKEITKDYIELRKESRETARNTARLLKNAFLKKDFSDIKDKNGNIIAAFEVPEESDDGSDFKMIEFDAETKSIKAVTKFYNSRMDTSKEWDKWLKPYFERIEFGETPKDNTFLSVEYTNKKVNGKNKLNASVQTYAKGYQTDGLMFGKRKADKYYTSMIYDNYESYRTNYEAGADIFMSGYFGGSPADIMKKDGLKGVKFDSALEYPKRQMQTGDTIFVINPYYINEKGNRD